MLIKLGDAVSTKSPDRWEPLPDDRQQLIKTVDGVYVEDAGFFEDGEVIQFTADFDKKSWELISQYWRQRQLVEVTDDGGQSCGKRRIVVKRFTKVKRFETIYTVEAELWKK